MKTSDLIKNVMTSGLKISKESLLEAIRKSQVKEFSLSTFEGKTSVVVIPLP
jgi:hypothetical protein